MTDPVRNPGRDPGRRAARQRDLGGLVVTCVAVAVIGTGVAAAFFPGWLDALMLFDVNAAVAWYRQLGAWGILGSVAMMAICALTFAPAEIVAIANGMTYGPVWGSVLTWASAMIGANIGFAFAKAIGPRIIVRMIGAGRFEQVSAWTNRRGAVALLGARCIPFLPFFALNLGAGAIGMRWWTFNWSTGLGILPAAIIFTALGDRAMHWPFYVWIGLAVVILAVLAVGRRLAKDLLGR